MFIREIGGGGYREFVISVGRVGGKRCYLEFMSLGFFGVVIREGAKDFYFVFVF